MDGLQLEKLYVLIEAQTKDFNNEMNKVNSRIDTMTSTVNKATTKGAKSFSTFGKAVIAAFSVRALIGFFNKFLEITKQTETFKNTLATAFTPLVNTITPFLDLVIQKIAIAIAYFTGFIQAIFGIGEATQSSAEATVEAATSVKNAYAGFDELQTISTDTGTATATVDAESLVNQEEMNKLVEESRQQWTWLGEDIRALNESISNLYDSIGGINGLLTIMLGAAAAFAAIWTYVKWGTIVEFFAGIAEYINLAWINAYEMFSMGASAETWLANVFYFLKTTVAGLVGWIALVVAVIAAVVQLFVEASARGEAFRQSLADLWQGFLDLFIGIYEGLKPFLEPIFFSLKILVGSLLVLWDGFVEVVGGVIRMIAEVFTVLLKGLRPFMPLIGAILGMLGVAISFIIDGVSALIALFGLLLKGVGIVFGFIADIIKDTGTLFDDVMQGMADGIKWVINQIVSLWNNTLGSWSIDIPKWVPLIGGQKWSMPIIPYLEDGGMLNAGSLFVAGESGAELIGSYNNQTTVMPLENSNFTGAMKQAVVAGVIEGIAASSNGSNQTTLVIDGMTLAKAVETNLNKLSTVQGGLKIAL